MISELLSEEQLVSTIEEFLNQNFRKDLKLTDVARETGIGISFIKRRYRQVTGQGVIERLHEIRINELVRLYEEDMKERGFAKIEALIFFVGYNNYQTFYRNFVKIKGVPPKPFLVEGKTADDRVVQLPERDKKIKVS